MNEDGISDSMFCDKQEEMKSKEIGYFQEEISNNTIIQIAFKWSDSWYFSSWAWIAMVIWGSFMES